MLPFPIKTLTHELTKEMDMSMSIYLDKNGEESDVTQLGEVAHIAFVQVLERYIHCHDDVASHIKLSITVAEETPFKLQPDNLYTLVVLHGVPVLPFEVEGKTSVVAKDLLFTYDDAGYNVVPVDPNMSVHEDENFHNSVN